MTHYRDHSVGPSPDPTVNIMTTLLITAPEFQRRESSRTRYTRGHSATYELVVGILQWKVSESRFGGLISASYKDSARKFSQITSLRSI